MDKLIENLWIVVIAAVFAIALFFAGWVVGRSGEQLKDANLASETLQKDAKSAVKIDNDADDTETKDEKRTAEVIEANRPWADVVMPDDVLRELHDKGIGPP